MGKIVNGNGHGTYELNIQKLVMTRLRILLETEIIVTKSITFDSPSSKTYTFEYWNSEGTNPLVKIADGYGDFTTEPIDDEDLPSIATFWMISPIFFQRYNWPIHTHNGIINHLHENIFLAAQFQISAIKIMM